MEGGPIYKRIVINNIDPPIGLGKGGVRKYFKDMLDKGGCRGGYIRRITYSTDTNSVEIVFPNNHTQISKNLLNGYHSTSGKKLWDWKEVRCTTDQANCVKMSCGSSDFMKILVSYGTTFCGNYSGKEEEEEEGKESESSLSGDIH